MVTLQWLHKLHFVKKFTITSLKEWEGGFYYKVEIVLNNQSVLFAKEYNDSGIRNYSFHWQDKDDQIIIRWDNAPYHPQISTYPFHQHSSGQVNESIEMSLELVLKEIESHHY